jgi:hypothetical protein
MPSSNTFAIKPIGDLVKKHLRGVSIDPFARDNAWATHTNDLNPATAAAHHMDASAFLDMLGGQGVVADCILLDPPYSPRQVADCYKAAGLPCNQQTTQSSALYKRVRDAARKLCKPGTVVLSFGWNSAGMGRGFEVLEILLVAHGGAHNDTICVVEQASRPSEEHSA